jgi:NADPH:quinone reductase-like Zn-dependent oxidoreductase
MTALTRARHSMNSSFQHVVITGTATGIGHAAAQLLAERGFHYSIHKKYFLCLSAGALLVATVMTVLIEMPLAHPARIVESGIVVIGIVGAASSEPQVHSGIIMLLFAFLFFGCLAPPRPGSLAY